MIRIAAALAGVLLVAGCASPSDRAPGPGFCRDLAARVYERGGYADMPRLTVAQAMAANGQFRLADGGKPSFAVSQIFDLESEPRVRVTHNPFRGCTHDQWQEADAGGQLRTIDGPRPPDRAELCAGDGQFSSFGTIARTPLYVREAVGVLDSRLAFFQRSRGHWRKSCDMEIHFRKAFRMHADFFCKHAICDHVRSSVVGWVERVHARGTQALDLPGLARVPCPWDQAPDAPLVGRCYELHLAGRQYLVHILVPADEGVANWHALASSLVDLRLVNAPGDYAYVGSFSVSAQRGALDRVAVN